jgi:14-3-3 protein epsilon
MEGNNNNAGHSATTYMANLSLTDEEDDLEIQIDEEDTQVQKQSFNLVGRFLTNRPIKVKTMMDKMGDIWQPGKGMDIEEAHPGLFVFRFFHQLDVQHILKQGPWSFDNHTLVLNSLADGVDPRDVPLINVPFWVQVHNLPAGYMSQRVGKAIGDYIGDFLEYDEKNDTSPWRKFMRIRVLVDIRTPLKRNKKIKKEGAESKLVNFKYERLGTFCYVCGMLGHSETKCPVLFEMAASDVKRNWSPDLRAELGRRQSGDSRWIRQGGDPTWVAPNPILMNNKCSGNKSGNNGTDNEERIQNNHEERGKGIKIADIFRDPGILFPKSSPKVNEHEETMEEDVDDELIVEGDRKRSRVLEQKRF